jgi:hypothetical protein
MEADIRRVKFWYHDQVGMALQPIVRIEELLSRKAKLDPVIRIRAIKLLHGELR